MEILLSSLFLWPSDSWQGSKCHSVGEEEFLQQMLLDQLDQHMYNTKVGALANNIHQNLLKVNANTGAKTRRFF